MRVRGVVFVNAPRFSIPVLRTLLRRRCSIVTIIARPSHPMNEGGVLAPSPIGRTTLGRNLPICRPRGVSNSPRVRRLVTLGPSLVIATTCKRFLPIGLLGTPHFHSVGIRTSLLPGCHNNTPIRCTVVGKRVRAKISVVCVRGGVSTKTILTRETVPVARRSSIKAVFLGLDRLNGGLLVRALPSFFRNGLIPRRRSRSTTAFSPGVGHRRRHVS